MNVKAFFSKILRTSFFCFVLLGVLCFPAVSAAQEQIVSYQTTATIEADSSVTLVERIAYDFGNEFKRGIYRDIDTIKKIDGRSYRLEISAVQVVNEEGEPYEVEILNRRTDVRLNIGGDVPRWNGVTVFEIQYTIDGLLLFTEEHDTLLLDAIGFDWGVPIRESIAEIRLPAPVAESDLVYECFAGRPGSRDNCNEVSLGTTSDSVDAAAGTINRLSFGHTSRLGNGAGLSVGLNFPKGLVTETAANEIEPLPLFLYGLLLAILLPLIYGIYQLYRRGDAPLRRPLVRQFDGPPDVSLSEAGVVLKHGYFSSHLAAELIHLAQLGYLKIIHTEKKILFTRNPEYFYVQLKSSEGLPDLQKMILDLVFDSRFAVAKTEVLNLLADDKSIHDEIEQDIASALTITKVSKMQNTFVKSFQLISKQAKVTAVKHDFFVDTFERARIAGAKQAFLYIAVSLVLAGVLAFGINLFYSERALEPFFGAAVIVGVLAGLHAIVLSFMVARLPKLSTKGVATKEHLLGLKEYIEVAEKERMEFHFDPQKNPELFEKLLPYAVILGVEKRWTKHLDEMNYQPNWYYSASGQPFSAAVISSAVSSVSSSSSGGTGTGVGSAGGGFGGGGGGSR